MLSFVYPARLSDDILMPPKSNVLKYLAFPNCSNISVIFDSGNESPIVKSELTFESLLLLGASVFRMRRPFLIQLIRVRSIDLC